MKKKEEIKNLKNKLKICKSKHELLKEIEKIHINIIRENTLLKKEIKRIKHENDSLRGTVYNLQSHYIAG